jgi:uncharacterized membrane protein YheB (UPF0754 family)
MNDRYLKSNTDITLILTYATQISRLCQNVILDLQLKKNHKEDFNFAINCAKNIHKTITSATNFELRKEIHNRTTNNFETGAFDNIMFNLGQMNDEQRNLADEILTEILEGTLKINRADEEK